MNMDSSQLIKMIGSLMFVISMLWLTLHLLYKYKNYDKKIHGWIQVIGSFNIGSKEKIILLQVKGKKILLGATSSSIQTLLVCEDVAEKDFNETLVDLTKKERVS